MKNLDNYEQRLLWALDLNARLPFTKLGKKIGLSPQLTKYKFESLLKRGIINNTMAVVNMYKLGWYAYRIYLRLEKESLNSDKVVLDYLKNSQYTVWIVSCIGKYDIEYLLLADTPIKAAQIVDEINENIGKYIKEYIVSPAVGNIHLNRMYLNPKLEQRKTVHYGFNTSEKNQLDLTDLKILKLLSTNARLSNIEISKEIDVSYNTIKYRIKELEKNKIIEGYRVFNNLEKLNRQFFKIIIYTKTLSKKDRNDILAFCSKELDMVYVNFCFGGWELELETESENNTKTLELLHRFLEKFGSFVKDYEIIQVLKEHKLNYLPNINLLIKDYKK